MTAKLTVFFFNVNAMTNNINAMTNDLNNMLCVTGCKNGLCGCAILGFWMDERSEMKFVFVY